MYAADFRRASRNALQGRWGVAILAAFVAGLLGGAGSGASFSVDLSAEDIEVLMKHMPWIVDVLSGQAGVAAIMSTVAFVIGGTILLGYSVFRLNLVDRREARFSDIFSQFHRFGDGFCLNLLTALFIFLWTLLFIIPGIIAGFSYAMAPYIMAENPNCGARQALAESKEMMRGNKWRLFCLRFSFIGWIILGVLTCGIGLLLVNPYMQVSEAEFYREISGTRYMTEEQPQVTLEY